jgi:hypothetical protein
MNGGSAIPLSNMLPMFEQRAKKLTMFQHEISRAWDIVAARGKRTVIYESFSVTVFKDDVEGMKVQILELNIAELEPMDGGVEGLGVVELRVFMDGSPVVRRMGEVKDACLEAFGWSRVDALVLTFHVGSRMK